MELVVYVARFLVGGALVCAFALVSEICAPKRFAGLFSAAPSVLTAGLAVTLLAETTAKAALTAGGAATGAIGMIAYCLAATPAIRRFKALRGSVVAVALWLVVSVAAWAIVAKALHW